MSPHSKAAKSLLTLAIVLLLQISFVSASKGQPSVNNPIATMPLPTQKPHASAKPPQQPDFTAASEQIIEKQEKIEALSKQIIDERLNLSEKNTSLSERYFTIFVSLLTTNVAIIAILISIFGVGVYRLIISRLEKDISEIVHKESSIVQAWAFNLLSYIWYEEYYEYVKKSLEGKSLNKHEIDKANASIRNAHNIAKHGLEFLNRHQPIDSIFSGKDAEALVVCIRLYNAKFYAYASGVLINNKELSKNEIDEIFRDCKNIYETLSKTKIMTPQYNFKWYNHAETIGFVCAYLGKHCSHNEMTEFGIKTLQDLAKGLKPSRKLKPPPESFSMEVKAEHFNSKRLGSL
ncbi:MAG TPA: hypothetical protein DCL19_07630 [Gammaproteobacteria bacterium]|nr:hypothetical protein [Gammaproteobacteria bacterium]|tara:strand:- start:754 stop:1797 length:1044 start_codon:yes stop_codon:yes gene_type:complete